MLESRRPEVECGKQPRAWLSPNDGLHWNVLFHLENGVIVLKGVCVCVCAGGKQPGGADPSCVGGVL